VAHISFGLDDLAINPFNEELLQALSGPVRSHGYGVDTTVEDYCYFIMRQTFPGRKSEYLSVRPSHSAQSVDHPLIVSGRSIPIMRRCVML
jgi:hypothetical protein